MGINQLNNTEVSLVPEKEKKNKRKTSQLDYFGASKWSPEIGGSLFGSRACHARQEVVKEAAKVQFGPAAAAGFIRAYAGRRQEV